MLGCNLKLSVDYFCLQTPEKALINLNMTQECEGLLKAYIHITIYHLGWSVGWIEPVNTHSCHVIYILYLVLS